MSTGVGTSVSGSALVVTGGGDGTLISVIEHNHDVWVNSANPNLSDPSTADFHGINSIEIDGQGGSDQIFYTGDSCRACGDQRQRRERPLHRG